MRPPGCSRTSPRLSRTSSEWSTSGLHALGDQQGPGRLRVLQHGEEDPGDSPSASSSSAARSELGGERAPRSIRSTSRFSWSSTTDAHHAGLLARFRQWRKSAMFGLYRANHGPLLSQSTSVDPRAWLQVPPPGDRTSAARRPREMSPLPPRDAAHSCPGRGPRPTSFRAEARPRREPPASRRRALDSLRWAREGSRDRFRRPRARPRQGAGGRPGGGRGDRGPGQPRHGRRGPVRGPARRACSTVPAIAALPAGTAWTWS